MNAIQDMAGVADAAYRLATDGALVRATDWQGTLYQKLSAPESDAGFMLITPAGAGKTEAVVIPALGTRRGGAPRRMFLIGPDGAPLDDYVYRLTPYIRAAVAGDETPRTMCVDLAEEDTRANICRRFFPDGTEDPTIETNPLEADVDLVLTTLSRFRALFFGSGGIHALPIALVEKNNIPVRRDLFFFDEAHGYDADGFGQFRRLVEYLFAEDTDIVVASTTLPRAMQEDFGFLENITVSSTAKPARRTLTHVPASNPLAVMEAQIRRSYYQNSRVFGVTETAADAETLYSQLASAYPHSVYLYYSEQEPEARRRTYAQLRELEKEGEGYLLLTTGNALETSDLDATVLVSGMCSPESLIRRAGRCNRRGDLAEAQILLVGDQLSSGVRPLLKVQEQEYLDALRTSQSAEFDPDFWKAFI